MATAHCVSKFTVSPGRSHRVTGLVLGGLLVAGFTGCKSAAPAGDDQLASSIQTQLAADSALQGQQISVSVQGGVATLNGSMGNEAQKALAARDAAGVPGVKEVHNFLSVAPAAAPLSAQVTTPPPAAEPLKPSAAIASVEPRRERERLHEAAPIERAQPPQPQQYGNPGSSYAAAPPPAAPAAPAFRTVTVPSGDDLPVRVTQTLDSATTQQGDPFSGVVASDIVIGGVVVIPAGSPVTGQVTEAHDAGHFKGASSLVVGLNGLTARGARLQLATDPYEVRGKGRGVNTAEKAGGGAAIGALLGGIFGGGKGAAIGAAAGGGLGAGANAVTRGQQVQIASESIVRFHLSAPIVVRVRSDGRSDATDPGLQRR